MGIEQELAKAYVEAGKPGRAFFEPAADLLLSRASTIKGIEPFFREYFSFARAETPSFGILPNPGQCADFPGPWPIPKTCVQLRGSRGTIKSLQPPAPTHGSGVTQVFLHRLFVGDAAWLFSFEQMGLFHIVKAFLDDFEHGAKTPFARDDESALVLEAMVRERRSFIGSRPLDRDSLYRSALGWSIKSKSTAIMNTAVADHLDRLFVLVLAYFRERRLPDAIRALASSGGGGTTLPATATLVEIKEAIRVLRSAIATFQYGRAHTSALSGIVWVISTLGLVHDLRSVIGVPSTYTELSQFVPATYDLLVGKEPVTPTRKNRFLLHRSLAEHLRSILIDIEVFAALEEDTDAVRQWLDLVEDEFQAYAAAYRDLHNIDLSAGGKHIHRA